MGVIKIKYRVLSLSIPCLPTRPTDWVLISKTMTVMIQVWNDEGILFDKLRIYSDTEPVLIPVIHWILSDEANRNGRGNNRTTAAAVSSAGTVTDVKKGLASTIKDRATNVGLKVIANELQFGLGSDNHHNNNGRALNQSAVTPAKQQISGNSELDLDAATNKEQKYLHKKFKRIASAAVEFGEAHTPNSEVAALTGVSSDTCIGGGGGGTSTDGFPIVVQVGASDNNRAVQVTVAKASPGSNFNENDRKSGALFSKSQVFRNGFNQISNETSCDSAPADASAIRVATLNSRPSSFDYANNPSRSECANNNHQQLELANRGGGHSNVQQSVADSESVQTTKHIHSGLDRDQHHLHDQHHRQVVTDNNSGGKESAEIDSECGGFEGGASSNHVLHNNNNIGRNVCHYCNLNCTKPSVLEKHIRSHTNERPYPCVPCGFAFKTKSNLYKHCRSRAHQLRSQGADIPPGQGGPDDDISAGSDQELSSSASGSDEVCAR